MGLFASGREETHVKSLLSVSGVWIDRVNNMSFQHFPVLVFIMYQTGQTNPMGIWDPAWKQVPQMRLTSGCVVFKGEWLLNGGKSSVAGFHLSDRHIPFLCSGRLHCRLYALTTGINGIVVYPPVKRALAASGRNSHATKTKGWKNRQNSYCKNATSEHFPERFRFNGLNRFVFV